MAALRSELAEKDGALAALAAAEDALRSAQLQLADKQAQLAALQAAAQEQATMQVRTRDLCWFSSWLLETPLCCVANAAVPVWCSMLQY